jgi:murein DD-endopeptidase MepM/ murein hydrolase activator NlpD
VDGSGNLYIADSGSQRIRKVDTSGMISTVAGSGTAGYNGDGGTASSAQLSNPKGVAVDGSGNLYIADYGNHRIRKVEDRIITPAPELTVTIGPGAAADSVKATITGAASSKYVVNISDSAMSTPYVGDAAPTSGANLVDGYTSGVDMTTGVAVGKYLQVYDVDTQGNVVTFYQKQLSVEDIKAAGGGVDSGVAEDYTITNGTGTENYENIYNDDKLVESIYISTDVVTKPADKVIERGVLKTSKTINSLGVLSSPYDGKISSGYGPRADGFHEGIDIVAISGSCKGANAYASLSGTVIQACYSSGLGNNVKIDNGNGFILIYAHL